MKSLVTARFEDRDSADLALMRLRRSGVSYEYGGLLTSGGERKVTAQVFSPYSPTMTNSLGSSDFFFPQIGSRAIFSREDSLPKGDVILKISVSGEDISRARDVLRSCGGYGIEVI